VKMAFLVNFLHFFANYATTKKTFSRNLSAQDILDTTYVSNLMFLGLHSPEISFGEKNPVSQTPTHLILLSMDFSAPH